MKLKALPENTFLKKITKLAFVSNFTVNELFPQQQAGQILNGLMFFEMT